MIAWPISAILDSGVFDTVIVSTDDDEIAAVASSAGADVPFVRPAELCDDYTATMPVMAHAIRWWEKNRGPLEFCCCVYPTAPFLRPGYIRQGFDILREKSDADFAFSVTTYAFPIFRSLQITQNGFVRMFWPENELKRSQDLPEAWHDAGQFYWGRRDAFLGDKSLFGGNSYPVILPRHSVQDIDTPEDWELAEKMFRASQDMGKAI
jgi:pseudaminic acid cytidylyltransferase